MPTYLINSDQSLQNTIGELRELYRVHKFVKVTARIGKDRSVPQNSISHAWYEQLARELKEDDALGWKCYSKLHIGVPIMRVEDEEFRSAHDAVLKRLTYEQKLIAMRHWPVTSIMSKTQLSKYLEMMQDHFRVMGVQLEFPDEA